MTNVVGGEQTARADHAIWWLPQPGNPGPYAWSDGSDVAGERRTAGNGKLYESAAARSAGQPKSARKLTVISLRGRAPG